MKLREAECGDDVLRILVTGSPPVRGGGGMPQRIVTISVPASVLRITGPDSRVIGPDPSYCTTASLEL